MILKNDFINAWQKALRSGKYKQCIGQMVKNSKEGDVEYDHLGIAVLVAHDLGIIPETFVSSIREFGEDLSLYQTQSQGYPGDWLNQFVPFNYEFKEVVVGDPPIIHNNISLVELSDYLNLTFKEIADVLEELKGGS